VTRLDVQSDFVFLSFPKKPLFYRDVRFFPARVVCEYVIVKCQDHVLCFAFWDDYGCVFAQIYQQKTVGKNVLFFLSVVLPVLCAGSSDVMLCTMSRVLGSLACHVTSITCVIVGPLVVLAVSVVANRLSAGELVEVVSGAVGIPTSRSSSTGDPVVGLRDSMSVASFCKPGTCVVL